jgi:hypothetical protein
MAQGFVRGVKTKKMQKKAFFISDLEIGFSLLSQKNMKKV